MNLFKFSLVLAAVFGSCIGCSNSPAPHLAEAARNTAPSPNGSGTSTPELVASGKELYAVNCLACHRDTGKGGKVTINGKKLDADDLTADHMKKHDDNELFTHISDGSPDDGMPAFKEKLKDEEIRAIAQYVRTLQAG